MLTTSSLPSVTIQQYYNTNDSIPYAVPFLPQFIHSITGRLSLLLPFPHFAHYPFPLATTSLCSGEYDIQTSEESSILEYRAMRMTEDDIFFSHRLWSHRRSHLYQGKTLLTHWKPRGRDEMRGQLDSSPCHWGPWIQVEVCSTLGIFGYATDKCLFLLLLAGVGFLLLVTESQQQNRKV